MPEPTRPTLDRPPSERYRQAAGGEVASPGPPASGGAAPADRGAPSWRPEITAIAVAAVTTLLVVLVGGVFASTVGQLFISGVGGAVVGLLLAASGRPERTRRWVAVGLAVAAVLLGAAGTWLLALGEGGTLGLVDFLWATTGILVPAQVLVAALVALWGLGAGPITD